MKAIYTTKSPKQTIELGKKLASLLKGGNVVLLYGELGSGKTHFIKGMADGLGIEATIKSPTYAYVNRYPVGNSHFPIPNSQKNPKSENRHSALSSTFGELKSKPWPKGNPKSNLYHYDLYRFREGDSSASSELSDISSIGFDETLEESNAINVVEWADRLGDRLPDKYISVSLEGAGNKRNITIKFVSPTILSEDKIEEYFEEWATPMHVRRHSEKVAEVAMKIAQAYIKKGEIVNPGLLYPACMLHDMNRVCDFRELVRDRFEEEVTDEKWKKWQSCRREFMGMHHADITAKILKERGFTDTAELIRLHKSINIVEESEAYNTLEKQIIYYADKRVKHSEIVTLKERFRDGKERYGKYDTAEERKLFDEVERRTFDLEKRLNISDF